MRLSDKKREAISQAVAAECFAKRKATLHKDFLQRNDYIEMDSPQGTLFLPLPFPYDFTITLPASLRATARDYVKNSRELQRLRLQRRSSLTHIMRPYRTDVGLKIAHPEGVGEVINAVNKGN